MPAWWPKARAARYWGVPPWHPIPEIWIGRAIAAIEAEAHAREVAEQRSGAGRR